MTGWLTGTTAAFPWFAPAAIGVVDGSIWKKWILFDPGARLIPGFSLTLSPPLHPNKHFLYPEGHVSNLKGEGQKKDAPRASSPRTKGKEGKEKERT